MDNCQEIIGKFDRIGEQAKFNPMRMHNIIYYGEVISEGNGIANFNKGLGFSMEYNFLSSLGVWAYDYTTKTDRSRWTRLRECVVKYIMLSKAPEVLDIFGRHPNRLNYVMLVGTLGKVFYNGYSFQAVQDYRNYSDVLPVNINTKYWLKQVCEIETMTTLGYYQEWLDAGIGFREGAYHYISLKELLKYDILDVSS